MTTLSLLKSSNHKRYIIHLYEGKVGSRGIAPMIEYGRPTGKGVSGVGSSKKNRSLALSKKTFHYVNHRYNNEF